MTTTTPSTAEIDAALAKHPKARAIAVHNFVSSCPLDGPMAAYNARQNLHADARAYGWNATTVTLIRKLLSL